jgi:hypothetical protein
MTEPWPWARFECSVVLEPINIEKKSLPRNLSAEPTGILTRPLLVEDCGGQLVRSYGGRAGRGEA